MLMAATAFAGLQFLVRLSNDMHVSQVLFFRSIISLLFCLQFLMAHKIPIRGNRPQWLLLRAFVGMVAMGIFFYTLQKLPLGASVSLKYLSPVFAALFAALILKERITPGRWLLFATAMTGVVLLKGFDTRVETFYLILGITGAAFAGGVFVIIRKIGNSEHTVVIISYFMALTTLVSGVMMIPFWINPTLLQWSMLMGMGVLGYYGQVWMTKGFQSEDVGKVAPIRYMEVVFSLILGLIFFSETYSPYAFLGIIMIVGSMLANVWLKK
ncbi:MAG: DMT family transporter [Bacteroidota bacterium]